MQDYKEILKSLLSNRPRGEVTRISEFLNVTPALVSQVLNGSRHITLEQAYLITEYFQLTEIETEYFLAAVQKAKAANDKLKKYWANKLKNLRIQDQSVRQKIGAQKELDDTAKAKFYSSYIYSAVRLFCSIGNGKTLDEICTKFKISRKKATEILQFLQEISLITQENNLFKMSEQVTYVSKDSNFVHRHHINWRMKGLSIIDEIKESELFYTCPCSLDKQTFDELKIDILDLISKAAKKTREAPAENLACLNIDLFWVDS